MRMLRQARQEDDLFRQGILKPVAEGVDAAKGSGEAAFSGAFARAKAFECKAGNFHGMKASRCRLCDAKSRQGAHSQALDASGCFARAFSKVITTR